MRRRTYIAGAAVTLVGGVLGYVYLRDGVPRTVSVVDASPRTVDLEAEMVKPRVTKEHSARVRLTWTNRSDSSALVSVDPPTGGDPEIGTKKGSDGNNHDLILVPVSADSDDLERRSETCWQLTRYLPIDGDVDRARLSPGETLQHEYDLWTRKPAIWCHQPGTYRFGQSHDHGPWELVLEVER